jgi:hypothetical protein
MLIYILSAMIFKLINLVLISFSLILALGLVIVRNKDNAMFQNKFLIGFSQNKYVNLSLVSALYTYRKLCSIPLPLFYGYVAFNMAILLFFAVFRFHNITTIGNITSKTYLLFFVTLIISAGFTISRVLFRIGHAINQNETLLKTVYEQLFKHTVNFASNIGRRMVGNMPPNPGGSGVDRHFALGVGMLGAAVVTAGCAVHMSISTQRGAIAAERSVDIQERTADIQERNAGNMPKDIFDDKWDPYGQRRKKS